MLPAIFHINFNRLFSGGSFRSFGKAVKPPKDEFSRVPAVEPPIDEFSSVPEVAVDPEGTFKYVLIKITRQFSDGIFSKMIVRGGKRGPYHGHIYNAVAEDLKAFGIHSQCKGGGKIKILPKEKKIIVYGISQGFGKADHQVTADLLKKTFKDYQVTVDHDRDWSLD